MLLSMGLRGSATLDLISEDFVYFLENKATLDKVSKESD